MPNKMNHKPKYHKYHLVPDRHKENYNRNPFYLALTWNTVLSNKPQFQEIISATKTFNEEAKVLSKEAVQEQMERFILQEEI